MPDFRLYKLHAKRPFFKSRIESATRWITEAQNYSFAVCVSWGKDSVALAHLAYSICGKADLYYQKSPARLPGDERVIEYFESLPGIRLFVEEKKTLAEYLDWLREVRLPHQRTRTGHKKIVGELKKQPGELWAKEHGYNALLLGMRAEENLSSRGKLFKTRGASCQLKSGLTIINPLASWSAIDVWAYIAVNNLPYHPLYDCETHGFTCESLRNSGVFATDWIQKNGRLQWLKYHFREQYNLLINEFPEVQNYG